MKTRIDLSAVRQDRNRTSSTHRNALPQFAVFVALTLLISAVPTSILASEPGPPDVVIGPYAAATFPQAFPFHGCGGDHVLLFGVQPTSTADSEIGVLVALRTTGTPLGRVTPPPVGWKVPLSIE